MSPRATRQLAAIYDVVDATRDHPTADQVFRRVRAVMPRVSLATVYRNLEKLRAQGRVRVMRLASGEAHYDARVTAHDHFACELCHAVHDLEATAPPAAVASLSADGWVVDWHTATLFGRCGDCARAGQAA